MAGITKKYRVKFHENYDWANDGIISKYYPEFIYVDEEGNRMYVRLADDSNEMQFVCADTKEEAKALAEAYIVDNIDKFI